MMFLPGMLQLFICDPEVIQDTQREKCLIDKNSFLKKDVFDKRLGDNVQSNSRSPDHSQRRRAFMNMFSGTSNFNMLDQIIETVLGKYFEKF